MSFSATKIKLDLKKMAVIILCMTLEKYSHVPSSIPMRFKNKKSLDEIFRNEIKFRPCIKIVSYHALYDSKIKKRPNFPTWWPFFPPKFIFHPKTNNLLFKNKPQVSTMKIICHYFIGIFRHCRPCFRI